MIKAGTQRRRGYRKARKLIVFVAAWMALIIIEMLIALVPTTAVAIITLPIAYEERGYPAIGGEWLIIILTFCGAFKVVHMVVCNRIFKEV